MRSIDINSKYRSVAIFCSVHGGKKDGKAHILWSDLEKRFGINWYTYIHELHVKGMLFGCNGYEYLRPQWAVMTPSERMENIKKMYPYPYEQKQSN